MPNKKKKNNIRLSIEKEWPSAKAFGTILSNYMITPDSTFTRLKTGAGDIEYFNEPYINYGSEDSPNIILNPNGNIPTLLYNPLNNSLDDIKLDLLHHYREYDPVYLDLLQDYTSTLDKSEILWNSLLGDLFRNKYPNTYNKHWKEWDALVNNTPDNSLYMVLGIDGSLRNLLAKEETIKKSNYAPREEAILQYLNTPKAQQAFNNIQLYLESNRLPEVIVTPNSHADGGKLSTPLDWNELSMREKAQYIRMGVSRGYKDIDSIKNVYNEFRNGGNLYGVGGTKGNKSTKRTSSVPQVTLKVIDYFTSKGLTDYQAAGLVGNFIRESLLNPEAINKYSGAYGIAQWLGSRKEALFKKYGEHPTLDLLLDFVWQELNSTHKSGLNNLKLSKNALEAARNAMGYYEFQAGPEGAIRAMNKSGQNGQASMDEGIRNAHNIMMNVSPDYRIEYKYPGIKPSNIQYKDITLPLFKYNGLTEYDKSFIVDDETLNKIINTLSNNTTLDTNIPFQQASLVENILPLATVTPKEPKPVFINPLAMIDLVNSMMIPLLITEAPKPLTATERLALMNEERNSFLQKELEDSIIRNSKLGIYDDEKLRRDAEDLRFYRNMSANGGKLYGLGGDEVRNTIRKQLYKNITPFGYHEPIHRTFNAVARNLKDDTRKAEDARINNLDPQASALDALWATYLNIPEDQRRNIDSKYGISKTKNGYYRFNSPEMIFNFEQDLSPHGLFGLLERKAVMMNGILGNYITGLGRDNKGDYIYYSDSRLNPDGTPDINTGWDINPYSNTVDGDTEETTEERGQYGQDKKDLSYKIGKALFGDTEDISMGIGTAVPIYDKIYLDDYYGIPKEYRGSQFLPEITVEAPKKALGGPLVRDAGMFSNEGNLFAIGGDKNSLTPSRVFVHSENTNNYNIPGFEKVIKKEKIKTDRTLSSKNDTYRNVVYYRSKEFPGKLLTYDLAVNIAREKGNLQGLEVGIMGHRTHIKGNSAGYIPVKAKGTRLKAYLDYTTGEYYLVDNKTNLIIASSSDEEVLENPQLWTNYHTGLNGDSNLAKDSFENNRGARITAVNRLAEQNLELNSPLHYVATKDGELIPVGNLTDKQFTEGINNAKEATANVIQLANPASLVNHAIMGGAKVLFDPNYTGELYVKGFDLNHMNQPVDLILGVGDLLEIEDPTLRFVSNFINPLSVGATVANSSMENMTFNMGKGKTTLIKVANPTKGVFSRQTKPQYQLYSNGAYPRGNHRFGVNNGGYQGGVNVQYSGNYTPIGGSHIENIVWPGLPYYNLGEVELNPVLFNSEAAPYNREFETVEYPEPYTVEYEPSGYNPYIAWKIENGLFGNPYGGGIVYDVSQTPTVNVNYSNEDVNRRRSQGRTGNTNPIYFKSKQNRTRNTDTSNKHALGGPLVDTTNAHIYDGTTEDSQQMNDNYIFTGKPSQYDFQVTAEAPTVYWDGFNWIGFNDLGQRETKGLNFNPSGARIIKDPQEFENARLLQARRKDINGTHRFAEDIRNFTTDLVMMPAGDILAEPLSKIGTKIASKIAKNIFKKGANNTALLVDNMPLHNDNVRFLNIVDNPQAITIGDETTNKAIERGRNKLVNWIESPFYNQRIMDEPLYTQSLDIVGDASQLIKNADINLKDRYVLSPTGETNGITLGNAVLKTVLNNGTELIDADTGLTINIADDLGSNADNTTLHELLHYMTNNSKGSPNMESAKIINGDWLSHPETHYDAINKIFRSKSSRWQDYILDLNDSLLPKYDKVVKLVMENPEEAVKYLKMAGRSEADAIDAINSLKSRYEYLYNIQELRAFLQELFLSKILPNLKNPNSALEIELFLVDNPTILENFSPYQLIQEIRPGTLKDYAKYFSAALGTLPIINKSVLNDK